MLRFIGIKTTTKAQTILLTLAAVVAAFAVIALASTAGGAKAASATTHGFAAPASAAAPARTTPPYDITLPKHVTWNVQKEKPPLLNLIRVYVHVKTNYTPQSFTGLVTLHIFKLVLTRHGLKWEARRAKAAPAAHLGLSDLAAPGSAVTWKFGGTPVYPDWICKKTGRYFIAMSSHVITDTGLRVDQILYEPHLKGYPLKGVDTAFGTRPPTRAEGMSMHC